MEKDSKVVKLHESILTKSKHILFGTRRRTIITVVIAVVIVFLGWLIFGRGSSQPQYQTAQVTRGSIIQTVSESGNVASGSQAGVGSPTTGIVTDIYVKDGDTVTQGQNLFKVRSTATAQEIASAYAAYQSAINSADLAYSNKIAAQATLEKDRAAVISASSDVTTMQDNINVSYPNPATKLPYTQNDIDAINSALTSARETFSSDEQKYLNADQGITAANASEQSAQLAYEATQDSVVTAPFDGTVANITVKPGDEITASSGNLSSELSSSSNSTTSNSPVLSIGNYSSPYIKVQASEVDVPKIQPGQKATITLDAFSGETFVGKVDQVDTAGTISSGVVTYNVFISFIAPSTEIKPGMSATVTIQIARKDNVLTVPSAAIQTTTGQSTIRVLKNVQVTYVPVTTGLASDTDTEITSGLSEGDTVVTGVTTTTSGSTGTSPFSGGLRGIGGFGGGGGGAARGGARGG